MEHHFEQRWNMIHTTGTTRWPLDGNLRPKIQLMEEKERRGYVTSSAIYFIFVIILELSKFYI